MPYQNILLIGGSGFVGSYIAAELAKRGKHVTVPTRRRERFKKLITLPTVDMVQADVHDEAQLARLMAGHDAVINLVGILQSDRGTPYGKAFKKAHVDLPAKIVSAAKKTGIQRIVQISALGVTDTGGASMYLRSKSDGEQIVKKSGLDWTVFRPSVVFGPEDKFLNMFASLARMVPVLPLAGAHVRFQPVYAGDVGRAVANSLDNVSTVGKTYDLAGPTVYRLRDLVRFAAAASGHPRPVFNMPGPFAYLQALAMEWLPGEPLMSRDNLDSMTVDNISTKPVAPELGITPTPLEPIAAQYLVPAQLPGEYDRFRGKAHR